MTMENAAALVTVTDAKDRLMRDPDIGLFAKVKGVETIDRAIEETPQETPWLTPGALFQGALGAGLGWGAGALLTKLLGTSSGPSSAIKTVGAGLGALYNAGAIKTGEAMGPISKLSNKELIKLAVARDIRNAVTLGFLEGARDSGLIENKEFCKTGSIKKFSKEATEFIADPALITEPLGGLIKGTAAAYNVAGTGLSHIFGDDATDEGVQRTMVEKRLLDRQADTLRSQRRNRVIAEVLKRRQQGTQPMMRY